MRSDITRQSTNVLALIATLAMNYLANALPLAGRATGEISDMFPVLFTPASYVFAIWGVIYLGLIAFAVFQALPSQRENPRLRRVGYLFALSGVLNIAWLFAWHYLQISLSLVFMLGLLLTLIAIYERLEIGKRPVPRAEAVAARLPFSIYLGWITVATVANVSITLYTLSWDGWGIPAAAWTVIVIAAASAVGLTILLRRGDVAFNLVLVWALIGIAVARWDVPLVAASALVAAALIAAALLYRLVRAQPLRTQPVPQP
jgi:translocator protein